MNLTRDFDHGGEHLRVRVARVAADHFRVQVGANEHDVTGRRLPDGRVRFEFGGRTYEAASARAGNGEAAIRRGDVHVTVGEDSWMLIGHTGGRVRGARESGGDGTIVAPMTGTILKVLVREGDAVSASDPVIVVAAMKMEHKLLAGIDGTVTEVTTSEGATVEQDQVLLRVTPTDPPAAPEVSTP